MHSQALLAVLLPLLATASPIDLIKRQFGGGSGFPSWPGTGGSGGGSGFPSFPGTGGGSGGTGGGFGGGSSTANELQNGPCKDISFIFARGTSEPGNVGSVIGPGFISELKKQVGADRVAAQGVNYPASWAGNTPGGDSQGKTSMTQFATKCPNAQIVLSGYSQGASVTHDTVRGLSADVKSRIKSIVVFGDPYNGQAFSGINAGNVKSFCAQGDTICSRGGVGGGTGGSGHLSYGRNAAEAATFVKNHVQ